MVRFWFVCLLLSTLGCRGPDRIVGEAVIRGETTGLFTDVQDLVCTQSRNLNDGELEAVFTFLVGDERRDWRIRTPWPVEPWRQVGPAIVTAPGYTALDNANTAGLVRLAAGGPSRAADGEPSDQADIVHIDLLRVFQSDAVPVPELNAGDSVITRTTVHCERSLL